MCRFKSVQMYKELKCRKELRIIRPVLILAAVLTIIALLIFPGNELLSWLPLEDIEFYYSVVPFLHIIVISIIAISACFISSSMLHPIITMSLLLCCIISGLLKVAGVMPAITLHVVYQSVSSYFIIALALYFLRLVNNSKDQEA